MKALVLAGTRLGPADPMARTVGVSHKALIPVGGAPMLARVLDALARTPQIEAAAVCIEAPSLVETMPGYREIAARLPITLLPAAAGPSLSTAEALTALGAPLLVTTADHALLEPEWISTFLNSVPAGVDAAAAVAGEAAVQAAAPGTRRTYLRFRGEAVSGCNLFLLATPRAAGVVDLWRTVEAERKKPLRLARLLGPGALAKFALGRLTLDEAAARLGALAGCRAAVVRLPFGRAAVDVDKPEDLALVERLLAADARA